MAVVTPSPRLGKFAASTKNPAPRNSERQPRNAKFHVASENPPRKRKLPTSPGRISMRQVGLINR